MAIEVMATVKATGRVLQTGSIQYSIGEFRLACERVRNGVIGKLQRINGKVGDLVEEPVEPGQDWDRWLGPAPMCPYSSFPRPRGVHGHFPAWRLYAEYGVGAIRDFGAQLIVATARVHQLPPLTTDTKL